MPEPQLRIRPYNKKEKKWLFLDYGLGYEHFDERWYLELMPQNEDFTLVCQWPYTFMGYDTRVRIHREIDLAWQAKEILKDWSLEGKL